MSWLYASGRNLARFCFNTFGRLQVTGREGMPPYGPLIVVANHMSYNDPPALVASLPRPLQFLGKEELFANPVTRAAMKGFHVHPLRKSTGGADGMRLALGLLAQDGAVVIFPEGRRSPGHSLIEGMPGAAYLAIKSQAPILPVGITGTEKFSPWRMPFPLCRFQVNIGHPFTPPVVEGRTTRELIAGVSDMIMHRIAETLPREYRGVYAFPRLDRAGGRPEQSQESPESPRRSNGEPNS